MILGSFTFSLQPGSNYTYVCSNYIQNTTIDFGIASPNLISVNIPNTIINMDYFSGGYGVFTNRKSCFRSGDYITKFEGNKIEDFNLKNSINRKYCLEIRKNYNITK